MTAIIAFILRFKWPVIGTGALFMFVLGYHTKTLLYESGELAELKKEISAHEKLEQQYHDASEVYQKQNQDILSDNQKLIEAANALPKDPDCSNPIPTGKLQLLRKARNLATR